MKIIEVLQGGINIQGSVREKGETLKVPPDDELDVMVMEGLVKLIGNEEQPDFQVLMEEE